MADPQDTKRQKRLESLRRRANKGEQAKLILGQLESVFEARRQSYFMELVTRTRADGRVYDAGVWKMVALDDLVQELDNDIGGGIAAEQKLEELKKDD